MTYSRAPKGSEFALPFAARLNEENVLTLR